jgi:hypothetical protein
MVLYRELDPQLPDLGWERTLPLAVTADAVRAIHECSDAGALGAMAGAARSYWAAAGGIAIGTSFGAAFLALGWDIAAAVAFALVAPAALATIEARRRARQWQAVIEARLTVLGAARG